jgi:hypothetical protein
MQGKSRHFGQVALALAIAFILCTEMMYGDNRLALKKNSDNSVIVELANQDGVAGAQFSVTSHGGLVLQTFEASDRLSAAGITVYQALKGDSTLNIVLLAPARSFLPNGVGIIGKVTFVPVNGSREDSARVVLQRVVLCDVAARSLEVTLSGACWSLNEKVIAPTSSIVLEQNFPNPFNPSTTIRYQLEKTAHVRLAVYDVAGRMVNLLVDGEESAGQHAVRWNVEGGRSGQPASGLYFARLNVGGEVAVMKMILTK